MSLPSFPEKDKQPSREEAINQIISSIAMEELGLSHIINTEGEKLQYAIGTIPGAEKLDTPPTIENLLDLNKSIHKTLDSTMLNQFLLRDKLQSALSASTMQGLPGSAATIAVGKVASVAYNMPLKIVNSGTSSEAVFDFEIPAGRPGVEVFGLQAGLISAGEVKIDADAPVAFDNVLKAYGTGITYDETTGEFILSKKGYYLIHWWVYVDGESVIPGESSSFSLNVDSHPYSRSSSEITSGQVSGSAAVVVENDTAALTLSNASGGTVTLKDTILRANIVITGFSV